MSSAEDWEWYRLPPIGLAIERYVHWPAGLAELPGGANFYQRVPDGDGLVFLRYGDRETPEFFVNSLTDAVQTPVTVDDRPVEFLGCPARQLAILQQSAAVGMYRSETPGPPPTHTALAATITRIEIIAFTANDRPVLVGFRIDLERLAAHRPTIDRIVASVSRLPDQHTDQLS